MSTKWAVFSCQPVYKLRCDQKHKVDQSSYLWWLEIRVQSDWLLDGEEPGATHPRKQALCAFADRECVLGAGSVQRRGGWVGGCYSWRSRHGTGQHHWAALCSQWPSCFQSAETQPLLMSGQIWHGAWPRLTSTHSAVWAHSCRACCFQVAQVRWHTLAPSWSDLLCVCVMCVFRCVPASVMGAKFLLEEPHCPGLHAGPLLGPGGHGEWRLRQSRCGRQPQYWRWCHSHFPTTGGQREEATAHSFPVCTRGKLWWKHTEVLVLHLFWN